MLVGLTLLSHVDLGLQTRSLTAAGGALTAVLHAVYNSHTHTHTFYTRVVLTRRISCPWRIFAELGH